MADADAEQESVRVLGRDALVRPSDRCRVVGPHVDDRSGNGNGRGGVECPLDEAEVCHRLAAHAEPGGRVAEGFGLNDELGPRRVVLGGVEPGAKSSQL